MVDEWLTGIIEDVLLNEKHEYKHFDKEKETWEVQTAPHVRFKFKLDGYEFPHYTRWMRASTNVKSNLYSKNLKYLCPNHDCEGKEIDIDKLKGVKVKTMWENNGDFQNIVQIRGLDPDLNIIVEKEEVSEVPQVSDEVPF